eukprot:5282926-Pyramimonas_sp.AAC.1
MSAPDRVASRRSGRLPRPPALQPSSRRKSLLPDALERPIDQWTSIELWTSPTAHPSRTRRRT